MNIYRFQLAQARPVLRFAACQQLVPCREDQTDPATWRQDAEPFLMVPPDIAGVFTTDVDPMRLYKKVMLVAGVGICLHNTSAPLAKPGALYLDDTQSPCAYADGHSRDDPNEIYTDGCDFALPVSLHDAYAFFNRHPHADYLLIAADGYTAQVAN